MFPFHTIFFIEKSPYSKLVLDRTFLLISRRDSPVRGKIYLLKIASIYGNFTPIGGGGGKMAIFGVFFEN